MKMKKMTGLIFSVILFSLILAGCQDSATVTQMPDPADTEPADDTETAADTETADEVDVVIELEATNNVFSEETITVRQGQTVRIELTVTQGFHDWVVDEFSAATEQAGPGNMVSVVFTADEAGEFEYYCSVSNHRAMGMVGTLIVEE